MSHSRMNPYRLAAQTASRQRPVASHVDNGTSENSAATPAMNRKKDFTCTQIA